MKFFTLLTISGLSLSVTPLLNAQESKSPWSFGVKAGVNLSTFDISSYVPSYGENGKTGFNAGLVVDYSLQNNFFLRSGLEFTTKGAKQEYEETRFGEKLVRLHIGKTHVRSNICNCL